MSIFPFCTSFTDKKSTHLITVTEKKYKCHESSAVKIMETADVAWQQSIEKRKTE